MRKLLQFAILAILAGAPLMRAQALRGAPGGMPKGIPKNGIAKKGPRLPGPTGAVERLLAMPPEQREQVLEKLPPPQQEALRKRFEQFDKRPPEERARLLKQWKQFESLSPETRELVTRQIQAFNALPEERRLLLRRALNQMSRLTPEEREQRMNNEAFKSRFSATELQMVRDLVENYPLPNR